jgi:hypothetical protein
LLTVCVLFVHDVSGDLHAAPIYVVFARQLLNVFGRQLRRNVVNNDFAFLLFTNDFGLANGLSQSLHFFLGEQGRLAVELGVGKRGVWRCPCSREC